MLSQLRKIDEQHKGEMGLLDDVQEFLKARAKLSVDYAAGLSKLSQQVRMHALPSANPWCAVSRKAQVVRHQLRGGPRQDVWRRAAHVLLSHPCSLSTELFRIMLNTSQEEAKAHQSCSDLLGNYVRARAPRRG